MSGVVFHHIAEGVMAQNLKLSVEDARDTTSRFIPDVKNGNVMAADYVLGRLGVKTNVNWDGSYANGNPVWGTAVPQAKNVQLTQISTQRNIIPDLTGMGARDAVYLLESRGVKAIIKGRGKVKSQSIYSGTSIKLGMACEFYMG